MEIMIDINNIYNISITIISITILVVCFYTKYTETKNYKNLGIVPRDPINKPNLIYLK